MLNIMRQFPIIVSNCLLSEANDILQTQNTFLKGKVTTRP